MIAGGGGTLVPHLTAVGFEPTSANTVDLKSTPLDLSGTLSLYYIYVVFLFPYFFLFSYIYDFYMFVIIFVFLSASFNVGVTLYFKHYIHHTH